jgi:hypothetical protein
MADDELFEEDDDYVVVEITDEDGNVFNYAQEMIIPVGDENFALLVPLREDLEEHEHGDGCDCGCEEEDDVIITKVVEDENGETLYIEPTDEEFEKVREAYEAMFDEEDE